MFFDTQHHTSRHGTLANLKIEKRCLKVLRITIRIWKWGKWNQAISFYWNYLWTPLIYQHQYNQLNWNTAKDAILYSQPSSNTLTSHQHASAHICTKYKYSVLFLYECNRHMLCYSIFKHLKLLEQTLFDSRWIDLTKQCALLWKPKTDIHSYLFITATVPPLC